MQGSVISIPKDAKSVWFNPDKEAGLLTTFIDNRGRKQYRYSAQAMKQGEKEKFKRAKYLGRNIRRIRNKLEKDLGRQRLSRQKVIALIIRLIDLGHFRVGTEKYSIENGTFGISTIRKDHIGFEGDKAKFEFVGKKGVEWNVQISEPLCIKALKELNEMIFNDDDKLFRFREKGQVKVVTAYMVDRYLEKYGVTAKDFRTYHATRIFAKVLYNMGTTESKKGVRKNIKKAVEVTAERLGHTTSICRSTYINPKVFKHYQKGEVDRLRRYFETGN